MAEFSPNILELLERYSPALWRATQLMTGVIMELVFLHHTRSTDLLRPQLKHLYPECL